MSIQTLNDILSTVYHSRRDRVMLHREASGWKSISSTELYRNVVGLSRAFESWGIGKGDRVAILSENRPEWTTTDFAALALGAVTVPIYSTQTAEQTAFILNDSGARIVAVSTKSQLEKVLSIQSQTRVERVLVMDAAENPRAVQMRKLFTRAQDSTASDEQFAARSRTITPDDLATIIYTSGTTGTSKGVMLTHGNMTSNIACSLEGFELRTQDEVSISFLPLSHVTARHVDFALLYRGVTLAYCSDLSELSRFLTEVQPTIFVAVPRVYEKIRQQVILKAVGFPKQSIYRWALKVGRAHRDEIMADAQPTARAWKIANRLVFSKVRQGMGGKAQEFISGGAPLGRELAEWFADIGIRILEGYGLTETSPVIAVNTPTASKLGTVGKPLSNVEVRLADDGEVLTRGPSVFKGYWNRPEETRAAFVDGWFKTGDIGHPRQRRLSFHHRSQKRSDQDVRRKIHRAAAHRKLAQAERVDWDRRGDRRSAKISRRPDRAALPRSGRLGARQQGRLRFATGTRRPTPRSRPSTKASSKKLNQNLARFEKLKRVLLVPEEFSWADGTLTHTFKVRRRGIETRYRKLIDDMYARAETAGQ